ncbi:oligogalacturonate-specific porin KdgM family protein [Orbus wheelerorum]|uniref:oligogalacturonate-specific porin KdgM family protein n=1 Tax=Orbus wheelerorum TaxID=3074111 RepID=UPI00370D1D10
MYYKLKKMSFCFALYSFSLYAIADTGQTTFQYEHNWKSIDRKHGDSLKLIHKTNDNWQYEFKFSTAVGGASLRDVLYDDMQGGSGGVVIQRTYILPNHLGSLIPSFELGFGKDLTLFQPGLKYAYKINNNWSTNLRYRYEWKKISQSERYKVAKIAGSQVSYVANGNVGRHRIDWGLNYSGIKALGLSYTFNYYIGDYTNTPYRVASGQLIKNKYSAYNGKKVDYEQEFKITWNYSKLLRPYFSLSDVSKNKTSDARQAKFKLGFNYLFGVADKSSLKTAYQTYFKYAHSYGTRSHYHGDNFGLYVDFDKYAYVGISVDTYNQQKNKLFIDDIVSNYYQMYGGYHFYLTDQLILTPHLQARFYSGGGYRAKSKTNLPHYQVGDVSDSQRLGTRYTPGLKFTWLSHNDLAIYAQYRYQYRKVSRNKREDTIQGYVGNTSRNRFDIGIDFTPFANWNVGYQFSYLKGNYVLQNNKKYDYQQAIDIDWQALDNWQINFSAQDVAKSLRSDTREAKLKLGLTYSF